MVRWACVLVLIGAGAWVLMWQPWSRSADSPPEDPEAFASQRDFPFESKQALEYLEEICDIGPRISGSEGMQQQQELLKKHFEKHGGKVAWQRFKVQQTSRTQPVEMANMIVSWNTDQSRRVILCSHYDTRPIADQERNRRKWEEPFISANDGGSGVAFLMELARHMKDLKIGVGVDFVLFDGEEYIFDPRPEPRGDKYFFGSEHFALEYRKRKGKERYQAAILLDMIAGKDACFPIEQNSWTQAGALVEVLWKIAGQQKCQAFQIREGPDVRDDHLALLAAGIPAVDIIDMDYPHWHRLSDVPENCSWQAMDQVARVIVTWLKLVK